jgi:hypothetical protein
VLLTLSGIGLPLGIPPAPENPAMQHVAPENCVLYSTWTALATPDPKSPNHTEQLMAEPEVQALGAELEKALKNFLQQSVRNSADPQLQQIPKIIPLWAKTLTTRSVAIFASRIEVQENRVSLEGGLLADAGDQSELLAASLVQMLTGENRKPTAITLGKLRFHRFAPPEGSGIESEITIGAAGQYVVIGLGKGAVEGMVERLRLKQTPKWLTDLQKRLPVDRRATMVYVNTPALVKTLLPLAGPDGEQIAASLGLQQVGPIASVSGLDDEGIVTRTFMAIDGEPRGLLTLLDGAGIKTADVAAIPKDATFATAFSLNMQRLYNVVTQVFVEHTPRGADEIERLEADFEELFGQRLSEDVLASLGDVWTLSISPSDGLLGATATVQVRDRAKLIALLGKAKMMLTNGPPGRAARIETTTFGDYEIQTLGIPEVPLRPAWCLTESHLIVSLAPTSIKAQLSARPEEQGLFTERRLAAALAGEGETLSITYQDSPKLFDATYGSLTFVLPLAMEAIREQNRRRGQPAPPAFNLLAIPSARSIRRHLLPGISVTKRTADGVESQSRQTFPMPSVGGTAPVVVALVLPAVQAAREAARRTQSANNLKQIALAMHNFHDTYARLPAAYNKSKEGKPLLSWRVHILPFIEQQELYRQFKLDEPWDSEHNKTLIAKMPKVYQSPNSTAGPGKTVYLTVRGDKMLFTAPSSDAMPTGIGIAQVTDGTSNTIMVVEANDDSAVIWTKPDDFVPNEADPLKGLLGLRPGGFMAALADSSVRIISDKIEPKMLMRLFIRADGEVVHIP